MKQAVTVRSVARNSPFFKGGLRKGDKIVTINGEKIRSELDFHFFIAEEQLLLSVERNSLPLHLAVKRISGDFSGVELVEQPVRRCINRCIFCFIDQMPPGLRHSLYVKDEDVRLSVFNGNYVTLSGFSNTDLDHLARIGLSPLYVSVHSTDDGIRRRMLRNMKAPPIMAQLSRLADEGICFHTQIVVCPGWNDGSVLKNSVRDLLSLGDAVRSVAVVPVGLTRFRNFALAPVDHRTARRVCRTISIISERTCKRDGIRKVFLADEFFIKAHLPVPDTSYYEDYPQIENGVGLVRQFVDGWNSGWKSSRVRKEKRRRNAVRGRKLVVTSVSAFPFIKKIADEYLTRQCDGVIEVVAVVNRFFGETVTVAGLLTASDIIRQVRKRMTGNTVEAVIIPSVIFNYAGYTLDGYSAARISKLLKKPLRILESFEEILNL